MLSSFPPIPELLPGLDEYWLARPGVSIWAVIGMLRANGDDPDATIRLYHLTPDEFAAALAFYERHHALIENRLAQNDAP